MAFFVKDFKYLEIQLEEIKSATNNFDESKVIGNGGFGKVYKGELSHSLGQSMVAIKRLDSNFGQGGSEFLKEIRMLSFYRHENLISLLGFCKEGDEMILVYEYAYRGSLDRLLNDVSLTWTQCLKIRLDAAIGLSFLHDPNGTHQRVLHCDIKSANILLDENFNAKVSDFGLSKIGPANHYNSILVTNALGTIGYCDPQFMQTYYLTKESDVYSFGVVLFEVLCGRLCMEYCNRQYKVLVPMWKKSYADNKIDEIIFQDLMQQMGPNSLETFSEIAYRCLANSREQRPQISLVVEKLKIALEFQKVHDTLSNLPPEFAELVKVAVNPLIYSSLEELKALLSEEVMLNRGETLFSINENGRHCESIYIRRCLDPEIFIGCFDNPRFPQGECHLYVEKFKAVVRAQFLTPLSTYSVNLVFRYYFDWDSKQYTPLIYKVDGETKELIMYDTDKREDGWFVVGLYNFTSKQTTIDLEIMFERCAFILIIAGFEFKPLEEKVTHNQVIEYKDIVMAASRSLAFTSLKELKVLLSKGVHLNSYKTWFSLNQNGDHCEMISIADCLLPDGSNDDYSHRYKFNRKSRFPAGFFQANKLGFGIHIQTEFLSPLITYTVNLVFNCDSFSKQGYVGLKYKLEGETRTSIVYLANKREDGLLMAELYQLTSNERILYLEIVFDDHEIDIKVEGILFQPLEKVEHGVLVRNQVDMQALNKNWKENLETTVDEHGKEYIKPPTRVALKDDGWTWKYLPKTSFKEETQDHGPSKFRISCNIEFKKQSGHTTYAAYLVYKQNVSDSQPAPALVKDTISHSNEALRIYLKTPQTPVIFSGDVCKYTRTHRPNVKCISQPRWDGWMEVQIWEFKTNTSTTRIPMDVELSSYDKRSFKGLEARGIEFRPIDKN